MSVNVGLIIFIAAMSAIIQCTMTIGFCLTGQFLSDHGMVPLIMAALCNRAGHYIFVLWFVSSFFLSIFFPHLISAVVDWMSTILLHMVWP